MAAIRGQPVLCHPGSSPSAYSRSIDKGIEPLLLPKQAEGLSPGCPETGCSLIGAMGLLQELYGWNQLEKLVKMIQNMFLSEQSQLICRSSWG